MIHSVIPSPSRAAGLIGGPVEEREPRDEIDLVRLLQAARRQLGLGVLCGLLGLAAGLLYILLIVPFYVATTSIIIDSRQLRAIKDVATLTEQPNNPDLGIMDSVVEVVKSERTALGVMERLKLLDDPTFVANDTPTLLKLQRTAQRWLDISRWFSGNSSDRGSNSSADADYRRERATIDVLLRNLDVSRKAKTWVVEINYASSNGERAAQIASAFAEAYLSERTTSAFEATRRASAWLERRLDELRRQSAQADMKVETFRAENRLVATDGIPILDQQLTQLTMQLSQARSATAEAAARYQHLRRVIDEKQTDTVVTESLTNLVVTELRKKWTELSRQLADLTARKYGSEHQQVINIKNEMAAYSRLIYEELGRIAASYESNWRVAKSREESLDAEVAALERKVGEANVARVQLRQLEQQAEAFRNLYNVFLSRYQDALQQETFPLTEARVITPAAKRLDPSYPRKPLVLGMGLVLGLVFGVCLGGLREVLDRTFRTGDQVRDQLDVPFLGYLPLVIGRSAVGSRLPRRERQVMNYSINRPLSGFSESLRRIKVATDLRTIDSTSRIIAVTSATQGEGKSTVAINLARLLAKQGASTLLIDADMRTSHLSSTMLPGAKAGLMEILCDGVPAADAIVRERDTGLHFLPAGSGRANVTASASLSSERMQSLLQAARGPFRYVIVDLPPAGAFVDGRAITPLVDTYVFVIEWGKITTDVVRNVLDDERGIREKLGGVVLNKVDMKRLHLYGDRAAA